MNPRLFPLTGLSSTVVLLAATALPAQAAAPALEAEMAATVETALRLAQAELRGTGTQAFVADALAGERPVKGAPYCADAVHETVQWLPDPQGGVANRIVRQQHTRLCRDGEGRTRQEVERDGRRRVYLHDPVAQESWVLDPEKRSARRVATSMVDPRWQRDPSDHAAWREYGERMREWARGLAERVKQQTGHAGAPAAMPAPPVAPVPPVPPVPPMPVVVLADEAAGGGREMHVRVLRGEGAGTAGADLPLPPGLALRAGSLAPRGPGVLTALGSKEIEGVRAGGERTTWTIEAGKLGNEKPIVITREVWRSPDLLLTLLSTDFDPRSGETRYRLTNLKRGEPGAALMQVPADYSRRGGPTSAPSPASGARGRG